jgi:hypothetical protein
MYFVLLSIANNKKAWVKEKIPPKTLTNAITIIRGGCDSKNVKNAETRLNMRLTKKVTLKNLSGLFLLPAIISMLFSFSL